LKRKKGKKEGKEKKKEAKGAWGEASEAFICRAEFRKRKKGRGGEGRDSLSSSIISAPLLRISERVGMERGGEKGKEEDLIFFSKNSPELFWTSTIRSNEKGRGKGEEKGAQEPRPALYEIFLLKKKGGGGKKTGDSDHGRCLPSGYCIGYGAEGKGKEGGENPATKPAAEFSEPIPFRTSSTKGEKEGREMVFSASPPPSSLSAKYQIERGGERRGGKKGRLSRSTRFP